MIHQDDALDDEKSSSNHSFDSTTSNQHPQLAALPTSSLSASSSGIMADYNAFQISIRLINDLFPLLVDVE
jgi:hypothetical protein